MSTTACKISNMNTLANENCLLAEKLRQEDPDQFYTLVRMHLSFVLDLNADECDGNSEKKNKAIKWSLPFTKKQKLCPKNNCEGALLTSEFIAQMHSIIKFLSKEENISQEGIFRRSGRVTRQQELKLLLQRGADLNLSEGQFSVHECATVLKNVLSELPESVLTDAHYPAYCQIAEFCGGRTPANQERLLRSIQLLILLLPKENRKFFQEIIQLLNLAITHENRNRMSAENLATLFTPHLLCPRKLSPEALHVNSQVMSRVVAFMIEKGVELFEIPPTVATDVKAYWDKKERKKLSPLKQMNESICDGTAANTVFTFVDRERTAQENQTNPTETALAQLYAYIQSLPESSKKRKLIKQFNKENGYGTPLTVGGKKRTKALNFGDSIKKHLAGFSKTSKRNAFHEGAGEEEEVTSPEHFSLKKVGDDNCEKINKENRLKPPLPIKSVGYNKKPLPKNETLFTSFEDDVKLGLRRSFKRSSKSCESLGNHSKPFKKDDVSCHSSESAPRTQTPLGTSVKYAKKRGSSSPIKTSPGKSPRTSDEYITPSILPVRQNRQIFNVSSQFQQRSQNFNKFNSSKSFFGSAQNLSLRNHELFKQNESAFPESCETPRRAISDFYLCDNSPEPGVENAIKTLQKFNAPAYVRSTNNNGFLTSPNNTNRLPILCGPKSSLLMTTSTPAPGNGCLMTPIVDKNNSMSPITKSTRRMPKAMQETMMTPRSRKPVISLSNTDLCNLTNGDDSLSEDESYSSRPKLPLGKRLILEDSNEDRGNDSLSSTFRNYLFSRSVLTASPVDLSFSSRTDDFLSMSEKNSSEDNENFKTLPEILNEAGLSESLLYCLDGNDPPSDSVNDDEAKLAHCTCSFSDCEDNSHQVYETAL